MNKITQRWDGIALTADPGRPGYTLEIQGFRLAGCEARVTSADGKPERVAWTGATRKGDIVRK